MKNIYFTAKELVEFIESRDEDEMLNFNENEGINRCGCLLVQFGREKGLSKSMVGGYRFVEDGCVNLEANKKDGDYVLELVATGVNEKTGREMMTYGKYRELIKDIIKQIKQS